MFKGLVHELRHHAPFTFLGTLIGVAVMLAFVYVPISPSVSKGLFQTFHPIHVLLSAMVTAGMYKLHGGGKLWAMVLIGYVGSVGIATLSDSLIPYVGELLLGLPHSRVHAGFIEEWWLVNPLAFIGIAVAYFKPATRIPHAGHVLLSMWASLLHIMMAFGSDQQLGVTEFVLVPVFLFIAVWVPCCTSDIIFPLIFSKGQTPVHGH